MTAEEIAAAALALPRRERGFIARALLASLRTDPAVDSSWDDEIRRRIRAIDAGETTLIPGEDVLAEVEPFLR